MSGVLLAGMAVRDAAAVEIMIGMQWRDRQVVTLDRHDVPALPELSAQAHACTHGVLDLGGLGMRSYAREHEARLLAFLAGRSAVLLVWGDGGGWLAQPLRGADGQRLVWLATPYTRHTMLDALRAALSSDAAAPASPVAKPAPKAAAAPVAPVQPEPAWRRAIALAEQLKVEATARAPAPRQTATAARGEVSAPQAAATTPPVSRPPLVPHAPAAEAPPRPQPEQIQVPAPPPVLPLSAAPPARPEPPEAVHPIESQPALERAPARHAPQPPQAPDEAPLVGVDAFKAVLRTFPSLRTLTQVGLLARLVRGNEAKLVHVGDETSFVTHVGQGWLVSDHPTADLVRLLQAPRPLDSFVVESLPAELTEAKMNQQLAERTDLARAGLDVLSWKLLCAALDTHPLEPTGELYFQLQRFPNFTQLGSVGPLDVQLAAICARTQQSVTQLARAFPGREQLVYRFAVLSILSGLAAVAIAPRAEPRRPAPARGDTPFTPTTPPPELRRGLLQSLLDKLF